MRPGAPGEDWPAGYPSPATSWRRLKRWTAEDIWLPVWRTFRSQLVMAGVLDWQEAFLDASFAPAQEGAPPEGKLTGRKARSGWWWSTARHSFGKHQGLGLGGRDNSGRSSPPNDQNLRPGRGRPRLDPKNYLQIKLMIRINCGKTWQAKASVSWSFFEKTGKTKESNPKN